MAAVRRRPRAHPRLGLAAAGLAAAAWTGAGVWAGFVVVALGVDAGTVLTAATVLVLLAGVGAGSLWAEVRAALAEPRSWSLFAQMGTRPRTYLIGRLLVPRAARLGAACCGALEHLRHGVLLRPEALTPAHWALIPLAAGAASPWASSMRPSASSASGGRRRRRPCSSRSRSSGRWSRPAGGGRPPGCRVRSRRCWPARRRMPSRPCPGRGRRSSGRRASRARSWPRRASTAPAP
ncbi:hypothetical protein [Clavibacter tessellarius]|uniref:hypothetical protein n=1 Tax=Clavibacter tessellarius TaxID=31965 RepID=UPI0032460BF2